MFKVYSTALIAAQTIVFASSTLPDWDGDAQMYSDYQYWGDYDHLTAEEKFNQLWSDLTIDQRGTQDYFYSEMANQFLMKTAQTTCRFQDDMPYIGEKSQDIHLGRKKKLTHTKGIHGAVKYVPKPGNPYTGLFASGADYAVMRMSDAGFLADNITDTPAFTPSVAIKMLISNQRSKNLFAQFNFDGVSDPYFFANDMSTHMLKSENQCMLDTLIKKFADVTDLVYQTGTGWIASTVQRGWWTHPSETLFPFKVTLVPNREEFPPFGENDTVVDFQTYFENWSPQYDENGDIVPVKIFDVMAMYDPDSEQELIGEFMLTSDLFRSSFGDENLFFRHEPMWSDFLKLKEQGEEGQRRFDLWNEHLERHSEEQTSNGVKAWWNKKVNPLSEDPKEDIWDGIYELKCPFAWLLE